MPKKSTTEFPWSRLVPTSGALYIMQFQKISIPTPREVIEGFKKHICLKEIEKHRAKLEYFPEGWRGEFKLKTFLGGYGYYLPVD